VLDLLVSKKHAKILYSSASWLEKDKSREFDFKPMGLIDSIFTPPEKSFVLSLNLPPDEISEESLFLIVDLEDSDCSVRVLYSRSVFTSDLRAKILQDFFTDVGSFVEYTTNSKISLLLNDGDGVRLSRFALKPTIIDDLDLNYGEDFTSKHHQNIVEKLTNEAGGVYIFSGQPGTGKTSYIKYLTSLVGRNFVFISNGMVQGLMEPRFVSLMADNKNAVLVLEDAENAVVKRGQDNASLVSNILNMSDGILSDVLNISFIITYNTSTSDVDEAILRKGRMKYFYQFNALSQVAAQKKIDSMKLSFQARGPMILGDIYNLDAQNNYQISDKRVGFAAR